MTRKSRRGLLPAGSVACETVRQELSARLDDEQTTVKAGVVADHVAKCKACSRFHGQAADLSRLFALRRSRPLPGGLVPMLSSIVHSDLSLRSSARRRWWGRPVTSRGGALPWMAAVVPACVAVVALPLGAAATAPPVSSHVPTPCTVGLVHHDRATR
jgi:anti-sigma factor RsiW